MIGRFPLSTSIINYSTPTYLGSHGIVYDSAGDRIAVCQWNGNKVTFLNATTLAILANVTISAPSQIKFDSVNNRFFVASADGTNPTPVNIINGNTYELTSNVIPTGLFIIRGFEFDYANDKLFISSYNTNFIEIYKISDLGHIGSIAVNNPIGIVFDSSGKLYVARGSNKVVDVYETITYTKTGSISGTTGTVTFSEAYSLAQDENNDLLIMTDRVEGKLVLLRKSTLTTIGTYSINSVTQVCTMGNKILATCQPLNLFAIIDKFYA